MVAETVEHKNRENARIVLEILETVGRGEAKSQRRLAAELGIALGLVNAYLKRCAKKGLVKISEAPARRYIYYLTPQGLAEKSRLTADYMMYSFSFIRRAKADCAQLLQEARVRGFEEIALLGASDLAEVVVICALESGVKIAGVVDPTGSHRQFCGLPVVESVSRLSGRCDAVLLTDLERTRESYLSARESFATERVLVPALLQSRLHLDLEGGR